MFHLAVIGAARVNVELLTATDWPGDSWLRRLITYRVHQKLLKLTRLGDSWLCRLTTYRVHQKLHKLTRLGDSWLRHLTTYKTHTVGWFVTTSSYNSQRAAETTQTHAVDQKPHRLTWPGNSWLRHLTTYSVHQKLLRHTGQPKNTQKFTKNWKAKSTCDYVTCDYVILQLTETYKVAQKHGHIVFTSVFVGLSVCQLKKLWMKFRETFERWTFVKFENLKMLLILTTPQQTVDMFLRTLWGLDLTFNSS